MKKIAYTLISGFVLSFLSSCNPISGSNLSVKQGYSVDMRMNPNSEYIVKSGDLKDGLSLFHTTMSFNAYNVSEKDFAKIVDDFQSTMEDYHVLFDRHHTYAFKDTPNEIINNLSYLNSQYGTGKKVRLDPILYNALKDAYQFTLESEGYYNLFIGALSDTYNNYIESAANVTSNTVAFAGKNAYHILGQMNVANVSQMVPKDQIQRALVCTPQVVQNPNGDYNFDEDILIFDDKTYSVTFNKYTPCNNVRGKVSISMSGQGKGIATNEFIEKNNKKTLLVNGGSSSISTNLSKINGKDWKLSLANPIFNELQAVVIPGGKNNYEAVLTTEGKTNISTSGYYENYYYVPFKADGTEKMFKLTDNVLSNKTYEDIEYFKRVNHIINPKTGYPVGFDPQIQYTEKGNDVAEGKSSVDFVTVLGDKTPLLDMYSTALLATNNLNEAYRLKEKLDKSFDTDTYMIYSYKVYNNNQSYKTFYNENIVPEVPGNEVSPTNYKFERRRALTEVNFTQMIRYPEELHGKIYLDLDNLNPNNKLVSQLKPYKI